MRTLSLANGFLSSVSDLVAQGIEGSVSARGERRAASEASRSRPKLQASRGRPGDRLLQSQQRGEQGMS